VGNDLVRAPRAAMASAELGVRCCPMGAGNSLSAARQAECGTSESPDSICTKFDLFFTVGGRMLRDERGMVFL
jgi:hypothetical protein